MRALALVLVALSLAVPAMAAPSALDNPALPGTGRYEKCLNFVRQDAGQALSAALDWERSGGGPAASHCAALALVALRRYGEAAGRLDDLARTLKAGAPERAELFDQAGNAWLLAANAAAAQASFTAALSLTPDDPEILTDRARARAMQKDWKGADADLTAALPQSPDRVALYVLRASARHAEGLKAEARTDIDAALKLRPNDPEALLQRGAMKYEDGDVAGAQVDWKSVVTLAPRSHAAAVARQHIADTAVPPASGGK
jgi:tetratricopeptide (TPR) repeat protein